MRNLVKENIGSIKELQTLLKANPVTSNKKPLKTKANTSRGATSAATGNTSTPVPDLESLRQQAEQLKNTSPDVIRT